MCKRERENRVCQMNKHLLFWGGMVLSTTPSSSAPHDLDVCSLQSKLAQLSNFTILSQKNVMERNEETSPKDGLDSDLEIHRQSKNYLDFREREKFNICYFHCITFECIAQWNVFQGFVSLWKRRPTRWFCQFLTFSHINSVFFQPNWVFRPQKS